MPKTKLQSLVFTALMVFCMVYCMTAYNVAWQMGTLRYSVFLTALKEMWAEYAVVFLLIFFVISKCAVKLAFRIVQPQNDRPIFVILTIQTFTVLLIVPTITLFSTFLHQGFHIDWFPQWIMLLLRCFPMALGLQIFAVGPLVRHIFWLIFPEKDTAQR